MSPPRPPLPGASPLPGRGGASQPLTAQLQAIAGRRTSFDNLFDIARQRMVAEQLVARGVVNKGVLESMGTVRRHDFAPAKELQWSYADKILGLPSPQPLETPYLIASVAERLEPKPTDRVLEINPGPGYEAAVLSSLVQAVYSVETVPHAGANLSMRGYTNNVFVRVGELGAGWPQAGPFDAIVVNASLEQLTPALIQQLKPGGRLILPAGEDDNLHLFIKSAGKLLPSGTWPVRPTPVPDNEVPLPPVREAIQLNKG